MAFNGIYGLQDNGEFKLSFVEQNGEPDKLGMTMLMFSGSHPQKQLSYMFHGLTMVPPDEIQTFSIFHDGVCLDYPDSDKPETWAEVLAPFQGNPNRLFAYMQKNCFHGYMTDGTGYAEQNDIDFAYIVHLDAGTLDYYSYHGRGVPFGDADDFLSYRLAQFPLKDLYEGRIRMKTGPAIMNNLLVPYTVPVCKIPFTP